MFSIYPMIIRTSKLQRWRCIYVTKWAVRIRPLAPGDIYGVHCSTSKLEDILLEIKSIKPRRIRKTLRKKNESRKQKKHMFQHVWKFWPIPTSDWLSIEIRDYLRTWYYLFAHTEVEEWLGRRVSQFSTKWSDKETSMVTWGSSKLRGPLNTWWIYTHFQ